MMFRKTFRPIFGSSEVTARVEAPMTGLRGAFREGVDGGVNFSFSPAQHSVGFCTNFCIFGFGLSVDISLGAWNTLFNVAIGASVPCASFDVDIVINSLPCMAALRENDAAEKALDEKNAIRRAKRQAKAEEQAKIPAKAQAKQLRAKARKKKYAGI